MSKTKQRGYSVAFLNHWMHTRIQYRIGRKSHSFRSNKTQAVLLKTKQRFILTECPGRIVIQIPQAIIKIVGRNSPLKCNNSRLQLIWWQINDYKMSDHQNTGESSSNWKNRQQVWS